MNWRNTGPTLLLAGLIVTGCGSGEQDLERFVSDVRAREAGPIEPIPEMMAYTPYTYRAEEQRAPFTPTVPERNERPANDLAPDADRKRDPLEAYPLDALRMVGTIERRGVTYALIQAPDNVIHRVSRGAYMGQNYGEIVRVAEDGVTLAEIVPDGLGGYVKRPAAIAPSS